MLAEKDGEGLVAQREEIDGAVVRSKCFFWLRPT
jgi:hypothetical protein